MHVYPFDGRNPDGPLRTTATINKCAEIAIERKLIVSIV